MRIYIISYFGEDPTLAQRRRQIHHDQIMWAREQGLDITVVAQHYAPTDYLDSVQYIGDNELRSPGGARNIALRDFFHSDQDWAIFADNDSTARSTVPDQDWLAEFRSMSMEALAEVDCFQPVNGGRVPFNKRIRDEIDVFQDHFVFERTPILKGSLFVLKNLRKHHGFELYQEEDWIVDPNTGLRIGMEDTRFGLELLQSGFSNYLFWNAKLAERGASTWLDPRDREARGRAVRYGKQYIAEWFGLEWNPDTNRVKTYEPIYLQSRRPKRLLVKLTL